jgi:hypothetical protein
VRVIRTRNRPPSHGPSGARTAAGDSTRMRSGTPGGGSVPRNTLVCRIGQRLVVVCLHLLDTCTYFLSLYVPQLSPDQPPAVITHRSTRPSHSIPEPQSRNAKDHPDPCARECHHPAPEPTRPRTRPEPRHPTRTIPHRFVAARPNPYPQPTPPKTRRPTTPFPRGSISLEHSAFPSRIADSP